MMNHTDAVRLMIDKFSGTLSPEGEIELATWLDASAENRTFYSDAMSVWLMSPEKKNHPNPETNQEWLKLVEQMEAPTVSISNPVMAVAIAATLLLTILAGVFIIRQPSSEKIRFASTEKSMMLTLPDSSIVWLRKNSTLSYNDNFGKNDRYVQLKGEASFAVAHNGKTFIVETSLANVKVIGTEFNVIASDSLSIVSVLKGKVNVGNEGTNINVGAGERVTVNAAQQIFKENSHGIRADMESANPARYIVVESTSHKNLVNATVAEGLVSSHAEFTTYKNIVLELTYKKSNGKSAAVEMKVEGVLRPGAKLSFRKKLNDLFSKSHPITIRLSQAQAVAE